MRNIIRLDTVDSTNNYAKQCILSGEACAPFAVTSREQSLGRGRYGHSFFSPRDNGVYFSYAFEADYEESAMLQLTVITAAITHKVLQAHCEDELSIKWINDIYRGSRKIAGILTERVDDPDRPGRYYIIIGIGVNILPCDFPIELSDIVGSLCDTGCAGTDLADSIINELYDIAANTFTGSETEGFGSLIEYYRSRCRELPADFGNELFNK